MNQPPRKFDQALGHAIGRLLHCPTPFKVATELTKQLTAERSLWVFVGEEGLFHRTPAEIETSLRQLSAMSAGEVECIGDGRRIPAQFTWEGRVTGIATATLPMDRMQVERSRELWPIVQNVFVNVRFPVLNDARRRGELAAKWVDQDENVCLMLKRMIWNLIDIDFRDRSHRVKNSGIFEDLIPLCGIVAAIRGAGFDTDLLYRRAIRLATGHAEMMAKYETDAEDHALARKVILDAIPPAALGVLGALPLDGYWTVPQIEKSSKLPRVAEYVRILRDSGALLSGEPLRKKGGRFAESYAVGPELQAVLLSGL